MGTKIMSLQTSLRRDVIAVYQEALINSYFLITLQPSAHLRSIINAI
jgi:hypothetical protein